MPSPRVGGLSIVSLLRAYGQGRVKPSEIFARVAQRAAALDGDGKNIDPEGLGSVWISRRTEEELVEKARTLERDYSVENKPLYGIPFAVKDNIDVAGMVTTNGIYPAGVNERATVSNPTVALLEEAGAIVVGKTNMDQLATGLVGTRSPYGPVHNAFDSRYISGGSSSGSAVSVAAGLCAFSLGTDTAGSGRVPAAFNNIYGWKPTRGLLSLRGVRPACATLDTVSVFALSVEDTRRIARCCAKFDMQDPFCQPIAPGPRLFPGSGGYRVAVPSEGSLFLADESVRALWHQTLDGLKATGAVLVEVDYAPFAEVARLLYEGPWVAERFHANKDLLKGGQPVARIDPVVRSIIEPAEQLCTHDAFAAFYRLQELERDISSTLRSVDCLVHPTAPTGPLRISSVLADPVKLNSQCGFYTNHMNLLDLCGLAVPVGFYDDMTVSGGVKLPFGVTISAAAGHDDLLLDVGGRLKSHFGIEPGAHRHPSFSGEEEAPQSATTNNGNEGKKSGSFSIFTEEPRVPVLVCGAHMSGLPLNWQLAEIGAHFVRDVRTSDAYRMVAFNEMDPARPGLYRVGQENGGTHIDCELWEVPTRTYGDLVRRIAKPLGIGHVELEDGTETQGFVCEAYEANKAVDISECGGWRAYLARLPVI